MKRYILVKKSPSIQLAHLYEHIFCMQVNKILLSKKLYLHADYDFTGKTYHGGLIHFELTQYTNKIKNVYKLLSKIPIDFDPHTVNLAINQLVAEMETGFKNDGYDNMIVEIKNLHNELWIKLDNFNLLDVKDFRQQSYPFYLSDKTIKSKKLKLKITFTGKDRAILPLFRQISHLIMANLENTLCDTYGYFSLEDSFKTNPNQYQLINVFNVGLADVHLDNNLITKTQYFIRTMAANNVFNNFAKQLSSLSYEKRPCETVNFENSYEDTLIFIGSKGWKSIATPKNINTILKNSSLEFSFGKQTISAPLI